MLLSKPVWVRPDIRRLHRLVFSSYAKFMFILVLGHYDVAQLCRQTRFQVEEPLHDFFNFVTWQWV